MPSPKIQFPHNGLLRVTAEPFRPPPRRTKYRDFVRTLSAGRPRRLWEFQTGGV